MDASLTDISTCDGFLLDSGGTTDGYGPDEDITTTICPDGSGGTHIQLIFSGPVIEPGDELCFFDGQNTNAPQLTCASEFEAGSAFIIQATAVNASGCITVSFRSNGNNEGLGWSADINCIAACQTIKAVLTNSEPAVAPVDTGWIDICPGDQVSLWGSGEYPQNGAVYTHADFTSDFSWDFGDGTSSSGTSVSHIYDEPGGYIVQLTITDQFGCQNSNFITQRIRVAPKPSFEIPSDLDQICAGDTVRLNAMINSMDASHTVSVLPSDGGFQTSGIRSDSLALPDGNGSSYQTTISFKDFSPGQLLTNINDLLGIWVNMEHSWMRDLEIRLTCPNGQSAILHNFNGTDGGEVFLGDPYENDEGMLSPVPGIGATYGWQVVPDNDFTWIEYGNFFLPPTLPSGSYQSYEPLSNFLGCPLNGEWTIEVTDLWSIDNGYIFSWSIEFEEDIYPEVETFSPELMTWRWEEHPSVFFETSDSIGASPQVAGEATYEFIVDDEFGCTWDTAVNIQILPFSHPDCYNCGDLLSPVPDTTICAGDPVELNVANPFADGSITFESVDNYAIGAGNHPPADPYYSTINVNSISPLTVNNPLTEIASICLDLTTDFNADIQLFLEAPDGQELMLSTNNGGGGQNYTQTCFTPDATLNIAAGNAPFTGNFQPEGNWVALQGSAINGPWTLRVSDQFGPANLGNLNWWNITFNTANEVEYAWSEPDPLSCVDCPDPVIQTEDNLSLLVQANDQMGCQAEEVVNINVLNSFDAPIVVCQEVVGGRVVISWNELSPGVTYEVNVNGSGWVTPNNGELSHLVSGLVIGDDVDIEVRVAISGANCLAASGSSSCQYLLCPLIVTPTEPAPYFVTCTDDCNGSIELTVTDGLEPYVFEITNTDTNVSLPDQGNGLITGLCPGNYQVVITDATGCSETFLFEISNPDPLTVNAVQDSLISCFGGSDGFASASGLGGIGNISYTWNDINQSSGQTIGNLSAGPITVTAMDENGCEAMATVIMEQPDSLILDFSTDPVRCLGGNDGTAMVIPMGGTPDYLYQWSGGNNPDQSEISELDAGLYSVTVEDQNGCQALGGVEVEQPQDGLTVTAVQTIQSCFGLNQSEATAVPVGGMEPLTYEWFPSGQVTQTADGLPVGLFTVTVTDAVGCSSEASVTLSQLDPIDINIVSTPPSCFGGSDGAMGVTQTTGGVGNYSYAWNNGDQDEFISGLQGDLVYTVTVSDEQGCTGTASRPLDNPPPMILSPLISDALCNGSQDGNILIESVENNNGLVTFQWDAATGNQASEQAINLGAGIYSVVATDANSCTIQETFEIGEPDAIEVAFTVVDNNCFGGMDASIDADVTGGTAGYNFQWSNGGNSAKLTDILSGLYFTTITDANGCIKEDSVMVDQPDEVQINIDVTDVSCFGKKDGMMSITAIGGTPPFTYSLDNDQFFGSSTLIALEAGEYPVFVMDARDCIYTTNTEVNEPPMLNLDIIGNNQNLDELVINSGEEVLLEADIENAIGLVTYDWTASWCSTLSCPGDSSDCEVAVTCDSPVAIPDFTNDYYLLIEDENGCKAEDHLQVHVRKERRVVVPTGFTPNNDGNNDLLLVHGRSGTTIDLFQVFDRWGELLYQDVELPINDTSRGWDGSFKSEPMAPGVYIWYIEATYSDGMTDTFKGETTLVR